MARRSPTEASVEEFYLYRVRDIDDPDEYAVFASLDGDVCARAHPITWSTLVRPHPFAVRDLEQHIPWAVAVGSWSTRAALSEMDGFEERTVRVKVPS